MVNKLEMILKELNTNGNFRASLFATSTGLVLASQKAEDVDDRVVAAMGSLLSDAAFKASEELLKKIKKIKSRAPTYSPTPSREQYHRPWRA